MQVNKQLQQEVFSRLDALAEKLGVVSSHLWEVLIRQAYIDAVLGIIFILLAGVAAYGLYRYVKLVDRKVSADEWDSGAWAPCIVVCIVGGLFILTVFATSLNDIVTGFGNPEFAALNKILSAAKGK